MKKLQAIVFAAIVGAILIQTEPVYAAAVQSATEKPDAALAHSSDQIDKGASIFRQNCAFCHGRDAGGGETGPDLTRSKLVSKDVAGNKIAPVVHNGRPEKGMPPFSFSDSQIASVVAFIHAQTVKAQSQEGNRRGVDAADLQTGNAVAGKQYFNGLGGCASCHSATGDLAGVATRYQGLQLEERMLYPRHVKSKIIVTLPSGQKITGVLAYQDEFTVALQDNSGIYHSWLTRKIKYSIDSPVDAHVTMLSIYTDADIHNLMAYLHTLQ